MMNLIKLLLKTVGRMAAALLLFLLLSLGWTALLFFVNPWAAAEPGQWPPNRPIAVTSGDSGLTRVIAYRKFADEKAKDPLLQPWPGTPSGTAQVGEASTSWQTVSGEAWQFEVSWDDRDHVMESRYRLEGELPVLVQARGRDAAIAFQGIVLALATLIVWKLAAWWRRRKLAATRS